MVQKWGKIFLLAPSLLFVSSSSCLAYPTLSRDKSVRGRDGEREILRDMKSKRERDRQKKRKREKIHRDKKKM